MLRGIKYVNHINETLKLDSRKVFVQDCDLYNYAWSAISKNDRISGFKKGIRPKSIVLVVKGASEAECNQLLNSLFDVMEKDTLAIKHGTLSIGEYYLKCYVTESKKSNYLQEQGFMRVTLQLTTDSSFWIKETKTTYGYGAGTVGTNLDFNRDFPSDYTSNLLGQQLNNTGFVDSNFRLQIYGPCENPSVTIAGHLYEVNTSVAANEYLTIDSVTKKILLTHTDGSTTNCFNLRNRESYVFQKIPVGLVNVYASADFKFDIVLLEERSEPKWT